MLLLYTQPCADWLSGVHFLLSASFDIIIDFSCQIFLHSIKWKRELCRVSGPEPGTSKHKQAFWPGKAPAGVGIWSASLFSFFLLSPWCPIPGVGAGRHLLFQLGALVLLGMCNLTGTYWFSKPNWWCTTCCPWLGVLLWFLCLFFVFLSYFKHTFHYFKK